MPDVPMPIPRPVSTGHPPMEMQVPLSSPSPFREGWAPSVVPEDQGRARIVYATSPFNPTAGFQPVRLF
jgi:hypothetical protein